MPLPLLAVPVVAFLLVVVLFLLIRWWIGKTLAATVFTLSLLLNFTIFCSLALGLVLALEIRDLQERMPTAPKLLLVERGPDILLAARFTDVSMEEGRLPPFQPLGQEQVARLRGLGEARYDSLTEEYYKVFVVKRELLEKLARPGKPSPLSPQSQAGQQDPAAVLRLVSAAREAFMSGDLDQVARVAVDMQKTFREQGMDEGVGLARQIEQAARARDMKALEALGPKLGQLAPPGVGGPAPLGAGGPPPMPLSGDVILKAIDAEDPAKVLAQYLPPQALQEMGSGEAAQVKLILLAYLLQGRGFDPILLLTEYQAGHIQVYPETLISTLAKLLPVAAF